jgi:hypothetical protein
VARITKRFGRGAEALGFHLISLALRATIVGWTSTR